VHGEISQHIPLNFSAPQVRNISVLVKGLMTTPCDHSAFSISSQINPVIFSEGNVLERQKFLKKFYVFVPPWMFVFWLMQYYTGQRPLVD
jgi:hypothetical protein